MTDQPRLTECPRCGTSLCFGPDDKSCSDQCILRLQSANDALRLALATAEQQRDTWEEQYKMLVGASREMDDLYEVESDRVESTHGQAIHRIRDGIDQLIACKAQLRAAEQRATTAEAERDATKSLLLRVSAWVNWGDSANSKYLLPLRSELREYNRRGAGVDLNLITALKAERDAALARVQALETVVAQITTWDNEQDTRTELPSWLRQKLEDARPRRKLSDTKIGMSGHVVIAPPDQEKP